MESTERGYAETSDIEMILQREFHFHQMKKDLKECEEQMRAIAYYLGVGGYNSDKFDPKIFGDKILKGIDDQVELWGAFTPVGKFFEEDFSGKVYIQMSMSQEDIGTVTLYKRGK